MLAVNSIYRLVELAMKKSEVKRVLEITNYYSLDFYKGIKSYEPSKKSFQPTEPPYHGCFWYPRR
jgi:hypothetical protein